MLEPVVRNFDAPTALATDRIIQQVTKVPAQRARVRWGAVGTLPTPGTGGFNTKNSDKYKEQTRNVDLIKVTNPEDPTQYVIIESASSAYFQHNDPDTITVSWTKTYTIYGPPQLKAALQPGFVNVKAATGPQSEFDFLAAGADGLHFNN